MKYYFVNYSLYCLAILLLMPIFPSYSIDLQPGEVRAPKTDINFAQFVYQHSQRGDRYVRGEQQMDDTGIRSQQFQMRLGRTFEIGKYPSAFYMQVLRGSIRLKGDLSHLKGDSGWGDVAFVQAIWPYVNHETQSYMGLAAYWVVPAGSYKADRVFNLGENRHRLALQAGYQTLLAKQLHGMVVADVTWFGENDEVGLAHNVLNQQALYAGQISLRYDFNARFAVGASYFYTIGGETELNGQDLNNQIRSHRYQLMGGIDIPLGRLSLRYGADLETENGYFEDQRWILSYTRFF